MTEPLMCWKCGTPITDQPMPLGRTAECSSCRADLHVCWMCEFYDVRVAAACREPVADEVLDKQRANFCSYFTPRPKAFQERGQEAVTAARAQLDALFGAAEIKNANDKADSRSEVDVAREQLEQLFGSGKKGDL
jgi:hypothetical protein